jgi:hypothetical protein
MMIIPYWQILELSIARTVIYCYTMEITRVHCILFNIIMSVCYTKNTSLGNIHQTENLCDIANTQMERVSDCCLMTNEEFFSYITMRTSYTQDTLSWLRVNQTLIFLLNAVFLVRTTQFDEYSPGLCSWIIHLYVGVL